jgi:hypothetical protein
MNYAKTSLQIFFENIREPATFGSNATTPLELDKAAG